MINQQVREYILCLEEKRFYDAHEALESIWFPRRFDNNGEVKLLKGFINASVSFELYKRGRHEQSKKVWNNYLKYRQFLFHKDIKNRNLYYKLSRVVEEINSDKITTLSRV